jgi:hypothetical protein
VKVTKCGICGKYFLDKSQYGIENFCDLCSTKYIDKKE